MQRNNNMLSKEAATHLPFQDRVLVEEMTGKLFPPLSGLNDVLVGGDEEVELMKVST
jgi:hypothetical protein